MKFIFIVFFVLLNSTLSFASHIDTLLIESPSMNKTISNIVILPNKYTTQKKFPVLYLLHGATDDYKSWLTNFPQLEKFADKYSMIIVCPDGGYTSWYFDSPIQEDIKYETYVTYELISFIDKKYKTIPNRTGRAITGLSMGGHGAFYLSFKHQDIWGAAGSMSGGLDIRPFPNNWDISLRLGKYSLNTELWEENTVINMLHLLDNNNLKLIFDCGTDDFFYDANERFHQKLVDNEIPHDYIVRPGKHNWEYWSNSIQYQFIFFNNFFKKKYK
ncbi:alpha/beta hydrolase [Aestuariibaculum sediminum]|uniref:Esterase family protein n=1 Tax=Aestuariibaculum sediminum TaxID=2770637 RepID=A0A8J6U7A1_9FLAO|nr:alpha/beta hydrolase family protein [Aestuariibaculum sediminum]MBD0831615.1 esterase family protein [Aestuariibaculum sediminum]